ncbi:FI21450p1 [Strongyloides ratti]|uniref:FI21450p1 n=1 Tax=Strongyloides ratti TaxID=34506 RepID=A0A090KYA8_STRRB|nr:FI21450p1 [Strongyloides ratti]CEF62421.1 FI21450p1 [Strongyloides ratti]
MGSTSFCDTSFSKMSGEGNQRFLKSIMKRSYNFHDNKSFNDPYSDMSAFVTSEIDETNTKKYQFQFTDNIKSRGCIRLLVIILTVIFSFILIISSPTMAIIPYILNYIDPTNFSEPICGIQCNGYAINIMLKTVLLTIAVFVFYCYSPSHLLPRLDKIRTSLGIFVVFILFSFWIFYYFRVIIDNVENYDGILSYSVSLLDVLLYTHYISLVLIYFKRIEKKFVISVTRDIDGEEHILNLGNMTIQEAAVEIGNYYVTNFSSFNDSFYRSKANFKFRKPDCNPMFKVYDVESGTNDNAISIPKGNVSAVVQAAVMRKDGNLTYEEMDAMERFDCKIKRYKHTLERVTEEAFSTIESFRYSERQNCGSDSTMDDYNASKTILSIISRPLQKYLRLTKKQSLFQKEVNLVNLQRCLRYNLSSKSFLKSFFSKIYPDRFVMKSYRWSIISDNIVTDSISEGLTFLLKTQMYNSDKDVKLYCQVLKVPFVNLSEVCY